MPRPDKGREMRGARRSDRFNDRITTWLPKLSLAVIAGCSIIPASQPAGVSSMHRQSCVIQGQDNSSAILLIKLPPPFPHNGRAYICVGFGSNVNIRQKNRTDMLTDSLKRLLRNVTAIEVIYNAVETFGEGAIGNSIVHITGN